MNGEKHKKNVQGNSKMKGSKNRWSERILTKEFQDAQCGSEYLQMFLDLHFVCRICHQSRCYLFENLFKK